MRNRLCKASIVLAFVSGLMLMNAGCDMGTYNNRFQERLGTSGGGGAFSAPDEEATSE